MNKTKYYPNSRFSAQVLQEAYDHYVSCLPKKHKESKPQEMSVKSGDESWSFDSREEFFAEVPKAESYSLDHIAGKRRLRIVCDSRWTLVLVQFPGRRKIESVFAVFEKHAEDSKVVSSAQPISVFIGHGHDKQWRDLKDHLHEQHGFQVRAYEVGPRAGLSVKEVLQELLQDSSFALLVLTGEDAHHDGELHARENVVHEIGLFQGRLGFSRAIALVEDGVKEFSNILGLNQIRFSNGNIRETFGDVVATIRREFEETSV